MNYFILAKIGNVNMKKTFQKTLIAAAAGVALMSAVGTASANSLLFPYFKVGAGVQSVVSLSNAGTASATEDVHYSYGVGAACAHYDTWGKLTANDIISHSVAAPSIGGVGVIPANDTSVPGYLPQNETEGFLIVSNVTTASVNALRGSLAVIEAASTGTFLSFPGIDNGLSTIAVGGKYSNVLNANANEGNFNLATLNAVGAGPAVAALNFPLTWLPTGTVTTTWKTLPIGNMNAFTTGAAQKWDANFGVLNLQNNVWNNDETFVSGSQPAGGGCLGTFTSGNLLTAGQAAAFLNDPIMSKGGGSGLYKGTGLLNGAGAPDNVILLKLQKVTTGSAYDRGTLVHRELGQVAAF
jgi:hypothetical protein